MHDDIAQAFLEVASEIIEALDNIPSPAALLDESGMVRWQNRASIALRGRRVGTEFTRYLAPEDRDDARSVLGQILAGGGSTDLPVRALKADGEYATLRGRWSVVHARDGSKVVVVLNLGETSDAQNPASESTPVTALTPRQLDVLRLLALGRSTNQIASELRLSPTTVRNHVANLLSALDAHSRLEAVAVARQRRLLDA
jgi:DNA-binding CsgD family transcriptional regulator